MLHVCLDADGASRTAVAAHPPRSASHQHTHFARPDLAQGLLRECAAEEASQQPPQPRTAREGGGDGAPAPGEVASASAVAPASATVAAAVAAVGARAAAAALVAAAARPWSPANAALFPDAARARAAMLVRVGGALAHRHGGATAHALCELWLSEVMPALVVRDV